MLTAHFVDYLERFVLGVGTVQRFTVFCCATAAFTDGFLYSGLFFMVPQAACDQNLPWEQLIYLFLPLLFGMIVGLLWFGGVSDVGGRRYSLCLSCIICFIASIIASASSLILIFEISAVFLGISLGGIHSGCRLLIFETLPMNSRGKYMAVLELLTGVGILAGVAWGYLLVSEEPSFGHFPPLRAWRLLFFVGALVCMLGSCLVSLAPLSPRQVLAHRRIVSVTILLKQFYSINKGEHESSYPNYILEPFVNAESRNYMRNQCTDYMAFLCRSIVSYIWETLKWPVTLPTSYLVLLHMCLFDGVIFINSLVSERLQMVGECEPPAGRAMTSAVFLQLCQRSAPPVYHYNVYLAVVALVPTILLPFAIDKCPRNIILGLGCFFTGVSSFVLAYEHGQPWEIVAGVTMVFSHSAALTTLNTITLETYPTKFRGTAYGVCKCASVLTLIGVSFVTDYSCFRMFGHLAYLFLVAVACSLVITDMNKQPISE